MWHLYWFDVQRCNEISCTGVDCDECFFGSLALKVFFSHSQLHLTCLQLFSLSRAVKCSGPLTPSSSPLLPETGQGLLEPLMKAISSRSCVGCVGRSHLFQCSQDCLILTKDGVNGWGAHCPSCWAQRFECDVGTTCGLCNRLENGLKFAWLSKQAPQLMARLLVHCNASLKIGVVEQAACVTRLTQWGPQWT